MRACKTLVLFIGEITKVENKIQKRIETLAECLYTFYVGRMMDFWGCQ